ncbi:MAG: HNH endonuclease signature motif containing protein [Bacteroidia bacterium]
MDYKKNYLNLVNGRKLLSRKKNKNIYYEKHHILPKCLGGTNDEKNLVLLTAKEHFIAHLLLTKIYEGKEKAKMIYALFRTCYGNDKIKIILNSRQFENLKNLRSKILMSQETKDKISKANKGNTNGRFNKGKLLLKRLKKN